MVVELTLAPSPEHGKATVLHESEQSWWMLRDADEYSLRAKGPALREAGDWVARFNRDVTRVLVHCNPALVSEKNGAKALANPFCYPLDQLLLMYHLAGREGFITHAAGAAYHGVGMIFPGRSGAGKSTIRGSWLAPQASSC